MKFESTVYHICEALNFLGTEILIATDPTEKRQLENEYLKLADLIPNKRFSGTFSETLSLNDKIKEIRNMVNSINNIHNQSN